MSSVLALYFLVMNNVNIYPNFLLTRWVLLEALDKVSPGIVNWKIANKPPIKMPFKKVENCNQVVKIGKQLKFSLVNIAGNDIVQGNKKLILGKFYAFLVAFTFNVSAGQFVYLSLMKICKMPSFQHIYGN